MTPIEILESLVKQFGDEADADALNTVKEQLVSTGYTPCSPCPYCRVGTDGVHVVLLARCMHPDRVKWTK